MRQAEIWRGFLLAATLGTGFAGRWRGLKRQRTDGRCRKAEGSIQRSEVRIQKTKEMKIGNRREIIEKRN